MSLEWARARALDNVLRERRRAQSIQGADAPEVEMVFPLRVTFWGASTTAVEMRNEPIGAAHRGEPAPQESDPSPLQLNEEREST
jgi:hypothetical protein